MNLKKKEIILIKNKMMKVSVTPELYSDLEKADLEKVGTQAYSGIAYFWAREYRNLMRDTSPPDRRRIHARLINEGLNPGISSNQHRRIIKEVLKK